MSRSFHRSLRIVAFFAIASSHLGCASIVGAEVGHRIGTGIVGTIPDVKTSYLCGLTTLASIVETESADYIKGSDVAFELDSVTEESGTKKIRVTSFSGSNLSMELEEDVSREQPITTLKVFMKYKEEGVSLWKRKDIASVAPFREIVNRIRTRVRSDGIKTVSDTLATPLLPE